MKPRMLCLWVALAACAPAVAGPLHQAAAANDLPALRAAIEAGEDVNAPDDSAWERTPLMHAAINGHALAARILIENGAAVQPQDEFADTPLRRAIQNTQGDQPAVLEVVNVLLANGADPDRDRDYNGRTPLVWALLYGDRRPPLITAAIVDGLLAAGAECVAAIDDQFDEGSQIRSRELAAKAGEDVLRVWDARCGQ